MEKALLLKDLMNEIKMPILYRVSMHVCIFLKKNIILIVNRFLWVPNPANQNLSNVRLYQSTVLVTSIITNMYESKCNHNLFYSKNNLERINVVCCSIWSSALSQYFSLFLQFLLRCAITSCVLVSLMFEKYTCMYDVRTSYTVYLIL